MEGLACGSGASDFGWAAFGGWGFGSWGEEIPAGVVIDDAGTGALAFVDENAASEGLIFGGEEF